MARKAKSNRTKQGNTGANLGFEDKLLGNMDAAEYKHVAICSLFNELMRVDGNGTWIAGLVGTQSERFRKVTLTILDSAFSYDGDGRLIQPGSQRTCGGKAATKDQVGQSMNKMVATWTT